MNIRQVDRIRWQDQRCFLTKADLAAIPVGTTPAVMLRWAGVATRTANEFLRALTAA